MDFDDVLEGAGVVGLIYSGIIGNKIFAVIALTMMFAGIVVAYLKSFKADEAPCVWCIKSVRKGGGHTYGGVLWVVM